MPKHIETYYKIIAVGSATFPTAFKGGEKMFDRDIVTTATHGIAHNDTTHNIKKKRAKKNIISFSGLVRNWIYDANEVFTIILTERGAKENVKNNK